jgi:hypothetical protein
MKGKVIEHLIYNDIERLPLLGLLPEITPQEGLGSCIDPLKLRPAFLARLDRVTIERTSKPTSPFVDDTEMLKDKEKQEQAATAERMMLNSVLDWINLQDDKR